MGFKPINSSPSFFETGRSSIPNNDNFTPAPLDFYNSQNMNFSDMLNTGNTGIAGSERTGTFGGIFNKPQMGDLPDLTSGNFFEGWSGKRNMETGVYTPGKFDTLANYGQLGLQGLNIGLGYRAAQDQRAAMKDNRAQMQLQNNATRLQLDNTLTNQYRRRLSAQGTPVDQLDTLAKAKAQEDMARYGLK